MVEFKMEQVKLKPRNFVVKYDRNRAARHKIQVRYHRRAKHIKQEQAQW